MLFAVTGACGQTGSVVTRHLLDAGHDVRVVVRRDEQARTWRSRGASAFVADLGERHSIRGAFAGVSGAYLMNPPAYEAQDIFAAARAVHSAMIEEAERSGVAHVVALSSVGAQHPSGTGNILTTHDLERQLASSSLRATILRAANFLENWAWSLPAAGSRGELPSMLTPVDVKLPMVSAVDVGRVAAELLLEGLAAPPLVELHGPRDYAPADAAAVLSTLLARPVRAVAVAESDWLKALAAQGFGRSASDAFVEMYRGFNSGHVAFSGEGEPRSGARSLSEVLQVAVDHLYSG